MTEFPLGWSYNPGAWAQRWPLIGLSLAGLALMVGLSLGEAHLLPLAGPKLSVLFRSQVFLLPAWLRTRGLPGSALAGIVYVLQMIAALAGGRCRWRAHPWLVLLFGFLTLLSAALNILPVAWPWIHLSQGNTFGLASAFIAVAIVGPAMDEVLAALQTLKRSRDSAWKSSGRFKSIFVKEPG